MKNKSKSRITLTREHIYKIALSAMLTAIAFLSVAIFRVKVQHLTYDLKDAIIAIGAIVCGPLYAIPMAAIAALLEMLSVSNTGFFGFIMNFLSSATFALTIGIIYKFRKTRATLVLSCIVAIVVTTAVMLPANIIVAPLFFANVSSSEVAKAIPKLYLPFNLMKAATGASILLLLYNPLFAALQRARLIENAEKRTESTRNKWKNYIPYAVGAVLMTAAVLGFVLYFKSSAQWFPGFGK